MRSNLILLTATAMLSLVAQASHASAADYFAQEDPLPDTTTLSGRALDADTEVLTPEGILTENDFITTRSLTPVDGSLTMTQEQQAEPEGLTMGFDAEDADTIAPAAGPAADAEVNPLYQPDAQPDAGQHAAASTATPATTLLPAPDESLAIPTETQTDSAPGTPLPQPAISPTTIY